LAITVRRRASGASRRRTVCERRFKAELRTSTLSPSTFVVGGAASDPACGMASRARTVSLGRSCHFGIPSTPILSRFGKPRDLRRRGRRVRASISPHRHSSWQPIDFAAAAACSWFPNHEAET
jgi:hypothetical protein